MVNTLTPMTEDMSIGDRVMHLLEMSNAGYFRTHAQVYQNIITIYRGETTGEDEFIVINVPEMELMFHSSAASFQEEQASIRFAEALEKEGYTVEPLFDPRKNPKYQEKDDVTIYMP